MQPELQVVTCMSDQQCKLLAYTCQLSALGIRCPVHALDFLLTVTICQGMRSSHRIAVDVSVTIRFVLPKEGRLKRFVFYRFV